MGDFKHKKRHFMSQDVDKSENQPFCQAPRHELSLFKKRFLYDLSHHLKFQSHQIGIPYQ